DVAAATRRGVLVTNTPGVLTDATADLAFALILAVARRIVEADKFLRDGKFKGWKADLLMGTDVYGRVLGIIGFGRIGQAVARRGLGFNMSILYSDARRATPEVESELRAQYVPLDELLRKADYVTIHADLNDQTRHMIGERELKLMGPEHYLINAARGPIVDEKALVRALKERWIKGAGLDVYEREPKTEPGLTDCWNAVLLATGRMFKSSLRYAELLGLTGPIINYQGAVVREIASGEVWYRCELTVPMQQRVLAFAEPRDWHVNAYVDEQVYTARARPEA